MPMRITGGRARGIRLKCPLRATRPATDALREALFSSLGERVLGARVLDLCAGTGAYGLEALSRGAAEVTFVEKGAEACRCLRENALAVCRSASCEPHQWCLQQGDVLRWAPLEGRRYELVMLDPPYAQLEVFWEMLGGCFAQWLEPDAWVVLEAPADVRPPVLPELELLKRLGKRGGQSPSLLIFSCQ